MNRLELTDEMFKGAISLERTEKYVRPWRVPFDRKALFEEVLLNAAGTPAGVRLRLATEATTIGLECEPFEEDRTFDLTIDNELVKTALLPGGAEEVFFSDLAEGAKTVDIWLPQRLPVSLRALLCDNEVEAAPDTAPRWVTYGSSITHCGEAHSPARTWPATAARLRKLNLTCLGFGGQCHLDPMMARLIRDLPAEVITIKAGINIYGGNTLNERAYRAAWIGTIQTIRDKHPDTPLGIISPVYSPPREEELNKADINLQQMREITLDAVNRVRDTLGDTNLHYFDGLSIFGTDMGDYLPDALHPNGDGYEILGRNVAEKVLPVLGF